MVDRILPSVIIIITITQPANIIWHRWVRANALDRRSGFSQILSFFFLVDLALLLVAKCCAAFVSHAVLVVPECNSQPATTAKLYRAPIMNYRLIMFEKRPGQVMSGHGRRRRSDNGECKKTGNAMKNVKVGIADARMERAYNKQVCKTTCR